MIEITSKWMRIFKTANLYLGFFGLGLCLAVPGPCLLDLQNIVNTDTEHIAFIYTSRSTGYAVGAIMGGIIFDAVKSKHAVMTISMFFAAGTILGIPWSRNIGTLAGYMIVNGLSLGVIDIGSNIILLTLWGSESGPYYQALHFTFGFGALVSPLIAAPFLGVYKSEDSMLDNNNFNNSMIFTSFPTAHFSNYSDSLNETNENFPQIFYPFTGIGIFCVMVTIIFLVVTILSPTEDVSTRDENVADVNKSRGFLFTVVILNVLLILVETGTEIGYAQMLTTYVVKGPLQLSSSTGSYMTSVFFLSFSIAKLISVFLSIKFSNLTLIVFDFIITTLGAAVLLFLSSHEWAVWLSSVLLGMGIASVYPCAVGWLDTYINVANKIASFFLVGGCIGEMVIPFIISYFIDSFPEVLEYVVAVTNVFCIVIVFILYIILRKREKKVEPKGQKSSNDSCPNANSVSA